MTYPQAVSILIENQNGHILCVTRKPKHITFGLPGGKVDPGETPEQAMRREMMEETGLKLGNLILIYATYQYDFMNYTYVTDSYTGDLYTKEEHKILWLPKKDIIVNSPFSDYNQEVLSSYKNYKSQIK